MTARAEKDRTMSPLIKLAAVSALAFTAGCAAQPRTLTAAHNTSLYSLHQPVVEHTNLVFDVATDGDKVSAGEQARLGAWFDSIGLRYGDSVSIDTPRGYDATGARHDVAEVAAVRGLLVADTAAPITEGGVGPGYVRVVASRSSAHVDGCPEWGNPDIDSPVRTHTNYGCATNSNLAAMIANPDDLVHGREASGEGAVGVAGRAVRVYRESQPTGRQALPATSTTTPR
jgi:pilus assembly protein CpaD